MRFSRMLLVVLLCWSPTSVLQAQQARQAPGSTSPARNSGVPQFQAQAPARSPSGQVPGIHAPAQPPAGEAAAPVQAPRAPFDLTPQEQAHLDSVLVEWERRTQGVKTFECQFAKLKYDLVFGSANKPTSVDEGTIKYSKPNQGLYEIVGARPEKWCTDGESFYEYNFDQKHVIQHILGPQAQGTGFAHCPVPFVFGARADDIKRRYWIRLVTPAEAKEEIWLDTYPKTQNDAGNYRRVDVILDARSMYPKAIQVYLPGGNQRDVYSFGKPLVNDPLRVFRRDVFSGPVPLGWKKVMEQQTASAPPAVEPRR